MEIFLLFLFETNSSQYTNMKIFFLLFLEKIVVNIVIWTYFYCFLCFFFCFFFERIVLNILIWTYFYYSFLKEIVSTILIWRHFYCFFEKISSEYPNMKIFFLFLEKLVLNILVWRYFHCFFFERNRFKHTNVKTFLLFFFKELVRNILKW